MKRIVLIDPISSTEMLAKRLKGKAKINAIWTNPIDFNIGHANYFSESIRAWESPHGEILKQAQVLSDTYSISGSVAGIPLSLEINRNTRLISTGQGNDLPLYNKISQQSCLQKEGVSEFPKQYDLSKIQR